MESNLTTSELDFILESLKYTRLNFESTAYPTYELKQEQMKKLEGIVAKVRLLKKELKSK